MTGHADYTVRQAAYDLRKLRGKGLVDKPSRSRRYQLQPTAARTITAPLTIRDKVIRPILPWWGRRPAHWTPIETLRIQMQTLFNDLGIAIGATAA
jgi:hypothetical protein